MEPYLFRYLLFQKFCNMYVCVYMCEVERDLESLLPWIIPLKKFTKGIPFNKEGARGSIKGP